MLRDLYDLERLLELERLEREARLRHVRRLGERRGHARQPHARLAYMGYILTLFRLV